MQGDQLLYLDHLGRPPFLLFALKKKKKLMPHTLPFPTTSAQTTGTRAALLAAQPLGDNAWSVASSGAGGREGAEHPTLNFLPPPHPDLQSHNGGRTI